MNTKELAKVYAKNRAQLVKALVQHKQQLNESIKKEDDLKSFVNIRLYMILQVSWLETSIQFIIHNYDKQVNNYQRRDIKSQRSQLEMWDFLIRAKFREYYRKPSANHKMQLAEGLPIVPNELPSDFVFKNKNGELVTTSLIVANVFGKRDRYVLRDIRKLKCSSEFHKRNFTLSFNIRKIPNGAEKKDPYYEIKKDGFTFLVMGYTGKKAGKFKEDFINAFN